MSYSIVSIKIPRKLKESFDKYKIDIGSVIKRTLEEKVKKMIEELETLVSEIEEEISRLSDEEIVKLIREDREGR